MKRLLSSAATSTAATEANAAPMITSSANTPVNADVQSAALPEAPQAQQDAIYGCT